MTKKWVSAVIAFVLVAALSSLALYGAGKEGLSWSLAVVIFSGVVALFTYRNVN